MSGEHLHYGTNENTQDKLSRGRYIKNRYVMGLGSY